MQNFKNLHQQDKPLLLGNVWNVHSAQLFEKNGYLAIGTSSAAIATSLGYEDGEKMPFSELLRIVKNIQSKVSIPLTVDIEGGYCSNKEELIQNITALQNLGIAGINIEDSISESSRKIADAESFAQTVALLKKHFDNSEHPLFLNVRTDNYIMGLSNAFEETLKRIKLYQKSGADGVFIPAVTDLEEIKKLTGAIDIPVNVMCMPNLPTFAELNEAGVKRISSGPFIYVNCATFMDEKLKEIEKTQSFMPLFRSNSQSE